MHPFSFILASRSPRRKMLLQQAGFQFECMEADINERPLPQETPAQLVQRLARQKSLLIQKRRPDSVILGADTVVTLDGRIYGKPADLTEAAEMLRCFSGRCQDVLTGLCILHPQRRPYLCCTTSRITFRTLNDALIREYFSLVNPLDKAGAYGIQSHGDLIISSLDGSLSNVIGLPMEALPDWLKTDCPGGSTAFSAE